MGTGKGSRGQGARLFDRVSRLLVQVRVAFLALWLPVTVGEHVVYGM